MTLKFEWQFKYRDESSVNAGSRRASRSRKSAGLPRTNRRPRNSVYLAALRGGNYPLRWATIATACPTRACRLSRSANSSTGSRKHPPEPPRGSDRIEILRRMRLRELKREVRHQGRSQEQGRRRTRQDQISPCASPMKLRIVDPHRTKKTCFFYRIDLIGENPSKDDPAV